MQIQKFIFEGYDVKQLEAAIRILLTYHRRVTHYVVGSSLGGLPYLALLWGEHKIGLPLIAPMESADAIRSQIEAWLKTAEYGREPDHDGSNSKGFRLTTEIPKIYDEQWRTQDWAFYTFIVIEPIWIEHGK